MIPFGDATGHPSPCTPEHECQRLHVRHDTTRQTTVSYQELECTTILASKPSILCRVHFLYVDPGKSSRFLVTFEDLSELWTRESSLALLFFWLSFYSCRQCPIQHDPVVNQNGAQEGYLRQRLQKQRQKGVSSYAGIVDLL